MDHTSSSSWIHSESELRALLGSPSELVANKDIPWLDHHCRDFIARSPFALLATSEASGRCDVSPRGDAPGFVCVLDSQRLLIPERPGNKRIDSLRNILSNPQIGLLFLIPGLGETLRVNGAARITKDEELLRPLAVQGKSPVVGIVVEVEECYMHCAKAFHRSRLWNPDAWPAQDDLPSPGRIIADHVGMEGITAERIAARLDDGYKNRLY